MYELTILCLANSRKPPSGRCVAGKRCDSAQAGAWVRPVSDRPGHEVSDEERRYEDGQLTQLFDIVSIPLLHPAPVLHQTENHVLDKNYWEKEGTATWNQVLGVLDPYDHAF